VRNLWVVAKKEYCRVVVRRGFIIGTVAIPLGMAVLIALTVVVVVLAENRLPVGYVDNAGILDISLQATLPDTDNHIEVLAFPDEETALAALEREEIQAFFVFPPDYPGSLQTDLYYLEKPPSNDVWRDFDDFVRVNFVSDFPEEVQHRLLEGPSITVWDTVSNREFSENGMINIFLPFVASFFFFMATMLAAGYMLRVVADEKENRTMEIMITSVTPGQLIGGKALGLLAVALTQLFIYLLAIVVVLKLGTSFVPAPQVPWSYLGVVMLFFFPAYALITAMMVGIGGAVTEIQQGQQVAGILNLFFVLPIFVVPVIIGNPGHPALVFMTLFPTTAFLTISLRWGLGTIPAWQLGLSWVLLVTTTIFMVWAATRIFRAGMLRYGQPLKLKTTVAAIKGG